MGSAEKLARVQWLYHFTDTRNLPSIRAMGGLYSMHWLKQLGAQNVFPGGNDWSLNADILSGMDQCVHLCFRRNHPMEFRAKERGQIEKTLWLYIDAQSIFKMDGVRFSSDVANKSGVESCPIQDASEKIDYDVLYSGWDLRNSEVQTRMTNAERCEVLVPDFVPIKYFERLLPNG
jgi:hypothetical protein